MVEYAAQKMEVSFTNIFSKYGLQLFVDLFTYSKEIFKRKLFCAVTFVFLEFS